MNLYIIYIYIYFVTLCYIYNGSMQDTSKTRVLNMTNNLYYSTGEIFMCFSEVKLLYATLSFMR